MGLFLLLPSAFERLYIWRGQSKSDDGNRQSDDFKSLNRSSEFILLIYVEGNTRILLCDNVTSL